MLQFLVISWTTSMGKKQFLVFLGVSVSSFSLLQNEESFANVRFIVVAEKEIKFNLSQQIVEKSKLIFSTNS